MEKFVRYLKSIFGFKNRGTGPRLSFELLFKRFRDVVDNNNRAIEIITDMGEKLSGDYIFDINYIKSAYAELSDAVYNSIQNFDALTRDGYPELREVFDRIDRQIKGIIYDVGLTSNEMVIFYEDITWDKSSEVGGKNSNLAELKNYLKLNVPDAFAITTHAFDEFIKHNNLQEKIKATVADATEPELRRLQDLIINAGIPPDLDIAIDKAIEKMKWRCGGSCFLAVRSSAEEEDSDFSFAGQFETILNVPLKKEAIEEAYKKVIASLFSVKSLVYLSRFGYDISSVKMAVGCVVMVDAVSSGVVYTKYPFHQTQEDFHKEEGVPFSFLPLPLPLPINWGSSDVLLINATWGLGKSLVEGEIDADLYVVRKDVNPETVDMKVGRKEFMIINLREGGTDNIKTPDDMVEKPCLTEEQIVEIAREAILIERHFKKPQDIEWAIDRNGRIFILQARPLRVDSEKSKGSCDTITPIPDANILIRDRGIVVQRGIAAGRVFVLKHMDELNNFHRGAVLVSRYDSSNFVRIMPYASAIITDIGTPTSHMASLCREFRVPTIVNVGDATQILQHDQEITIIADEESIAIYDGIIRDFLKQGNGQAESDSMTMEDIYEFRKKRYILRYIVPLNLIDPLMDNFTPGGCKTVHDILRFIHEKSVTELVESARYGLKGRHPVKLNLPIPAGIMVVDIGGGLNVEARRDAGSSKATFEQITSIPLRAIIKGMMHPGVWHSEAVSLKVNDFIASMMRMPDIVSNSESYVGYNIAIASGEYVNLSLRFGYHFNMIDCYCSANARNNHIYFRFVGGATDITKRSRRIQLIADILKEYGFNIRTKGDLIVARLANIRQDEMENILDHLGRLIAYTRQLDAALHDDSVVERYARKFLEGEYGVPKKDR